MIFFPSPPFFPLFGSKGWVVSQVNSQLCVGEPNTMAHSEEDVEETKKHLFCSETRRVQAFPALFMKPQSVWMNYATVVT